LEQCRIQWKQADQHWAQQVTELKHTLLRVQQQPQQQNKTGESNNNNSATNTQVLELHDKLRQLEDERNELQTCLDEALLELEAVDAELGNHTPAEVQQLRQENQRLQEAVAKQRAIQQQQQLQLGDAEYDTLEGLQHLYRWLLERSQEGGEEKKNDTMPQTSPELLDAIHHVLESMPSLRQDQQRGTNNNITNTSSLSESTPMVEKVALLESQIVSYRDDLQQRDQSTTELRSNLQEAVALIKPLQDAVDMADRQKNDLQQEIERLRNDHEIETRELLDELRTCQQNLRLREQECDRLHHDIHRLQIELEDAKEIAQVRQTLHHGLSPSAAAAAATAAKTPPPSEQPQELSSLSKARADLKAKRAQEQTLRSLLKDAQNRFQSLNQQNQSVEALNQQLQGRLRDVEEHVGHNGSADDDNHSVVNKLEQQLSTLKAQLQDKTTELENLREQAQRPSPEVMKRMHELEARLAKAEGELRHKLQSEMVLSKSLKDALGLLKPLKNHLEEAEAENKDLSKEVKTLRRKITSMEISGMGTVVASQNGVDPHKSLLGSGNLAANNHADDKILRDKEQLEETVRHLEQENSQLHDALDELSRMNDGGMSPKGNGNSIVSSKAEVRLNQEIVELKSRYEVTQSRLEDAYVENHTLVEALKEKEEAEKDAVEGMRILREKLRKTEMDLQNAKYIATSALVKVEQAKSLENNSSINSGFETESHTVLSLEEKAIELGVRPSLASLSQSPSDNSVKARQFPQQHHPQKQQQPSYNSGSGGQPNMHHNGTNHTSGWAGKRSRLADF
jgi:DNA repair exonuclease SbcCD ATPase subunit